MAQARIIISSNHILQVASQFHVNIFSLAIWKFPPQQVLSMLGSFHPNPPKRLFLPFCLLARFGRRPILCNYEHQIFTLSMICTTPPTLSSSFFSFFLLQSGSSDARTIQNIKGKKSLKKKKNTIILESGLIGKMPSNIEGNPIFNIVCFLIDMTG